MAGRSLESRSTNKCFTPFFSSAAKISLPVNGPAPDFGEMFRRRVLHLCGWESGLAIL
jgi:hypothetical protein